MPAEIRNGDLFLSGQEREWWEAFATWFKAAQGRVHSSDGELIGYLLGACHYAKGDFEHFGNVEAAAQLDSSISLTESGNFSVNIPIALTCLGAQISAERRSQLRPHIEAWVSDMARGS